MTVKRYFLESRSSRDDFRTDSNSIHGFMFTVIGSTVYIAELLWDNSTKEFSVQPRTVFCPPRRTETVAPVVNDNTWHFESNGTTRYTIEFARNIYKVLKTQYQFHPRPVEDILQYDNLKLFV